MEEEAGAQEAEVMSSSQNGESMGGGRLFKAFSRRRLARITPKKPGPPYTGARTRGRRRV